LEALEIQFYREVADGCGFDVPSASSPWVDVARLNGTCESLIADLTPDSDPTSQGAPPRNLYWVRDFTVAHEQYHEDNHLRPLVEAEFVPAVTALLQDPKWCGTGCGSPNLSGLDAEVHRVWTETVTGPWEAVVIRDARERETYAADAPKYDALVAAIRARCNPPPPPLGGTP
jgi:hypothetical protein